MADPTERTPAGRHAASDSSRIKGSDYEVTGYVKREPSGIRTQQCEAVPMRKQLRWLLVSVAFLAPVLVGLAILWPRDVSVRLPLGLIVDSDVLDVGSVAPNSKLKSEFHLQNDGPHTIEIASARPECGCTVVAVETPVLPPGTRASIPIAFLAGKHEGPFRWKVDLAYRDKIQSNTPTIDVPLYFVGSVVRSIGELVLIPNQIDFGDLTPQSRANVRVHVLGKRLKVAELPDGIVLKPPYRPTMVSPLASSGHEQSKIIEVSLGPILGSLAPGPHLTSVQFPVDGSDVVVSLPIHFRLVDDVVVTPPALYSVLERGAERISLALNARATTGTHMAIESVKGRWLEGWDASPGSNQTEINVELDFHTTHDAFLQSVLRDVILIRFSKPHSEVSVPVTIVRYDSTDRRPIIAGPGQE
jgi:hypothetical protein